MQALISRAEARLQNTMRKTMLTIVGVVFALSGIAFLSTAAFIVLEDQWGTLGTIMFFGGVSLAISLVLFLLARSASKKPEPEPEHTKPVTVGDLVDAFSTGMSAARRTK